MKKHGKLAWVQEFGKTRIMYYRIGGQVAAWAVYYKDYLDSTNTLEPFDYSLPCVGRDIETVSKGFD